MAVVSVEGPLGRAGFELSAEVPLEKNPSLGLDAVDGRRGRDPRGRTLPRAGSIMPETPRKIWNMRGLNNNSRFRINLNG